MKAGTVRKNGSFLFAKIKRISLDFKSISDGFIKQKGVTVQDTDRDRRGKVAVLFGRDKGK